MGAITDGFATTWRDFNTTGVPASGEHKPEKSEIRAVGVTIEQVIATAVTGAGVSVVKTTRALLDADLAHVAGTVAFVYADATNANNDFYVKTGASGAGAWTLTGALHGAVNATLEQNGGRYVYANRTGATTANAVVLTTDGGVPVPAYRTFDIYAFNVLLANTTTTPTVAINGLAPKTLRKSDGGELAAGDIFVGCHLGIRYHASADEFRIVFQSPPPKNATGSFVVFTQSNASTNAFIGSVSPDPIADIFAVVFAHKATQLQGEGGVSYRIPEIVDEPRQLRTVNNDQVTPGTWAVNDTLLFRYVPAGHYELIAVLKSTESLDADSAFAIMQRANAVGNGVIYALRAVGN